jgi:hypothetical protein
MKYLKKFENFDLGRFSEMDSDEQEWLNHVKDINGDEYDSEDVLDDEIEDEDEIEMRRKVWGDEVIEKKKVNPGFQAYLDKQKAKKGNKDEEKGNKKSKPDFLDLDKDGDKKETMKKAARDAKDNKKEEPKKGLSAAQKKLPKPLQDAILKKQK